MREAFPSAWPALALAALAVSTANAFVMGFFGSNPGVATSLRAMCDTGFFDMIVLSFLSGFGISKNRLEMDSFRCTVPITDPRVGTSGCASIAQDISYCRGKNIKMLLGLGGSADVSTYGFSSPQQAIDTASYLWSKFLSTGSASSAAGSAERPLGASPLDGVALDIEGNTDQQYYNLLVNDLRRTNPNLLIVGTPECAFSTNNAMSTMVTNVPFDYLMPQFYNDPNCALYQPQFESTLNRWMSLYNNETSRMNILLGAPGDSSAYVQNTGSRLLSGGQLGAIVNAHRNNSVRNPLVGVGIWSTKSNEGLYSSLSNKLDTPWDTNAASKLTIKSTIWFMMMLTTFTIHWHVA